MTFHIFSARRYNNGNDEGSAPVFGPSGNTHMNHNGRVKEAHSYNDRGNLLGLSLKHFSTRFTPTFHCEHLFTDFTRRITTHPETQTVATAKRA